MDFTSGFGFDASPGGVGGDNGYVRARESIRYEMPAGAERDHERARIDLEDGFSIHDYRSKLKLLNDSGTTRTLENREGLLCPACEHEFDRLFVTERETTTFDSPVERPFCLARTAEKVLLCLH